MADTRCRTCRFWTLGAPALANAERDPRSRPNIGTCQIDPPKLYESGWGFPVSMFPEVHADRFCDGWEGLGGGGPDDGEEATDNNVVSLGRVAA